MSMQLWVPILFFGLQKNCTVPGGDYIGYMRDGDGKDGDGDGDDANSK